MHVAEFQIRCPAAMIRFVRYSVILLLLGAAAIFALGAKGYWDALSDADALGRRADMLIAEGRGGDALGNRYRSLLLTVEDPNFFGHLGVDFTTPGAGATTVTQSLAKRVAFEEFRPGIGKIRQTGYALGLERRLGKDQILALWPDSLEMGRGPDGWMTGFFAVSEAVYRRPPADLTEDEFLSLVAILIAPSRFDLTTEDAGLRDRIRRINRLTAGSCTAENHRDVWLDGCG